MKKFKKKKVASESKAKKYAKTFAKRTLKPQKVNRKIKL